MANDNLTEPEGKDSTFYADIRCREKDGVLGLGAVVGTCNVGEW